MCASARPARAVFFDFEDQIPGNPPSLCGVSFVDGPYRIFDRGRGNLALERPSADIADSDPLVMRFAAPADSVSLLAGHGGAAGVKVTATLQALDATGALVASSGDVTVGGSVTTSISVSTASPVIAEVRLSVGAGNPLQPPEQAMERIDDLDVDAALSPCLPDTSPPWVSILYPPSGTIVLTDAIAIIVRGVDDRGLSSFAYRVDHADGSSTELPAALQPGGLGDFTSGAFGSPPIPIYPGVLAEGENQIRATVCDTALPVPNCSTSGPVLVVATPPPDTLNLWTSAVEITQAAQDEISESPFRRYSGYSEEYPGVPLVADKTTAVRVYVGIEGVTSAFAANVVLHASRVLPGGGLVSLGRTEPVLEVATPGEVLDPTVSSQGVIVVLPPEWDDAGEIELVAQVNPPNFFVGQAAPGVPTCGECPLPLPECQDDPSDPYTRCNDDANSLQLTHVVFHPTPRPGLRVVPVPIDAVAFGSPPTVGFLPVPRAFLQATFPLPDDPLLATPGLQVDAPLAPLAVASSSCGGFLRAVRRGVSISSLGIPAAQTLTVLGTVPGSVTPTSGDFSCGGVASRPGRSAWAKQSGRSASAHEVGHNRGLKHASSAHGEADGGAYEEWPYPHGSIGNAGFDPTQIGTLRVVAPATAAGGESSGAHEMMSYGRSRWISPRNYVRMLDRLHGIFASLPPDRYCDVGGAVAACAVPDPATPCPVCYTDADCVAQFGAGTTCIDAFGSGAVAGAGAAGGSASAAAGPGMFLVVTGEIGESGAALDPVYAVPLSDAPAPASEGTHSLEVRDRAGVLVARQSFDPDAVESQGGGAFDVLVFEQAIPLPAEVGSVTLFEGTTRLASARASASAPAVEVIAPDGGESWKLGGLAQQIRWRGQDGDGDALRYSVFLSRDAGDTWSPLAVDLEATELPVPTAQIGGTSAALVRVAASDGVLSGMDESDAVFGIDVKPRWVEILRPASGGVHPADEPLRPHGQVQSLEAGAGAVPGAGEMLRFRATPLLGGPVVSADGPAPQMRLLPGIHDLALELTGAGSTLLAQDHVAVWVSSAPLTLRPAVLGAGGLEIRGLVELPSGASLPHPGAILAFFEPAGAALQSFAFQLEAGPRTGGYPSYVLRSGGGAEVGALRFDKATTAWLLSLTLAGATLPDPTQAGFGETTRFLLHLGSSAWAGMLEIDRDGDGRVDSADNCPFYATQLVADTDRDGRGDACECTDQDGNGRNSVLDLLAINRAIFDPRQVTPLCDGTGEGKCNVADMIAANLEIFSPGNTSVCPRQPFPGP